MSKMDAQDKKWEIESDARLLRESADLMSDKKRFSAAKK